MATIKMVSTVAGPTVSLQPGQVLDVPGRINMETAKAWVEAGAAVWVEAPAPETAVLPEPETAVLPRKRKRG